VLPFPTNDPEMRLHDIAARLRVTERNAHGIVTDLTAAGYISEHQDGRRDRDQFVAHRRFQSPLPARGPSGKFSPCSPLASRRRKGDIAEPAASGGQRSGHVSHQAACSAST
jgi:hypothetical protein